MSVSVGFRSYFGPVTGLLISVVAGKGENQISALEHLTKKLPTMQNLGTQQMDDRTYPNMNTSASTSQDLHKTHEKHSSHKSLESP